MRKKAGFITPDPAVPAVQLTYPDDQPLPMWWYRPVRIIEAGRVELVSTQGSGDLVSAARGDGMIEISPQQKGVATHFPFYSWSIT
jgi:hypothetical protein